MPADYRALLTSLGKTGDFKDGIATREMGAVINARMGLNTWAAFAGTDDDAMVAGA